MEGHRLMANKAIKPVKHPLASGVQFISKHRFALYEKIGPGEHPCHWCGRMMEWLPGHGTRGNALVVGHLDRNPRNNASENLAPSCKACSSRRVQDDEVFVTRKNGKRVRAVQRNCKYCNGPFLAIPAEIRNGKGRFCSRDCADRGRRKH